MIETTTTKAKVSNLEKIVLILQQTGLRNS